ncbi:MAG: VWA domain-containing protein [Fimbriiglobus sp.]|jgi:hypothetical protein|nr:VWA domain-containing protein [Fimbriiglobus sp.]
MTPTYPLLLLGALAIALPIALHFLFKAWYRPLPWAAMEFLRKSIEQTAKRIKFRELILLLLRCAALIFLALAVARFADSWGLWGGSGSSVDAVLVVDTSYSMGARDGGKTRFERAKEAALAVVDKLPPGSTVQVVTCSDRATAVPFSPTNLDQARAVINNLALTSQAGDLAPGLAEATAALDRVPGGNRAEVYVLSDFQRNGLEGTAGTKAADLRRRASVTALRCCPAATAGNGQTTQPKVKNVAVTDITFPDAIPHSGTRLPFTVLLKNTGREKVTNVAVSLTVDGSDNGIDSGLAPEIEPGATFPVTMTAALGDPGTRLLTARIGQPQTEVGGKMVATASQPDDLPGDNRFDKLILVRRTIGVLVVDGRPDPRDSRESAAHYVAQAVAPVSDTLRDDYFIKAKTLPTELAVNEKLTDYQVVVLADVPADAADKPGIPALTPEFVTALTKFVADGGGLIIGGGEFVLPESYNRVLGSGGAKLLPFDLTKRVSTTPEAPFKPAVDTVAPLSMVARLKANPFNTATADVDVIAALAANEDPTSAGRVLIRLDNQTPLLSAKPVGSGEVVFAHTSLDGTWTNWPAKAVSYVSTVRFLLSHLTGKSGKGGNLTAGETISWIAPDAATEFELVKPDGGRTRVGKAVAANGGKPTVTAADTFVAGDYKIQPVGREVDDAPRFAVNPELRESESLDVVTDEEGEARLGVRPKSVANLDPDSLVSRPDKEWPTIALLLVLFAFACGEMAWAWFCGRAG